MNRKQKALVIGSALVVSVLIINTFFSSLQQGETEVEKLKVVATFYPLAYFAREIGGEYVSVTQLIPDNTELHSWQPSTSDITTADDASIIVYNGVNLDHWMETDILPAIDTSNTCIVETTKDITLFETDQLTGSEQGHEKPRDPHTWISPFIAKQQAEKIFEALIQTDPDHQEYYKEHWHLLKAKFEKLDKDFMDGLLVKQKNEIFVIHAAYWYLANRYGFEQHGVIGISSDEQPSAAAIANLVDLMIEHKNFVIYVNPIYPEEYARTLKNELQKQSGHSIQILNLYFMLGPINGLDYFQQQEANLENLKLSLKPN